MRFKATAALLFSALAALAADLVPLDRNVNTLDYHLRLAPLRNNDAAATVYWNYSDSANCRWARFTIPALLSSHHELGFESHYTVGCRQNGTDSIIVTGQFSGQYPTAQSIGYSAILHVTPTSAALCLGGKEIAERIPVDFSHIQPGGIGYECALPLEELINAVHATELKVIEPSLITEIEELKERIAQSTDPAEAFWTYLDRDTPPASAALGGFYTIATVKEPDGSYSIIYIDGATAASAAWKPMMLKGRLHPTIFKDHYNLEWVQPSGTLLDTDTSADIILDGSVLRLNFPLNNASIRFQKTELK